jgi:hypothetical protein
MMEMNRESREGGEVGRSQAGVEADRGGGGGCRVE